MSLKSQSVYTFDESSPIKGSFTVGALSYPKRLRLLASMNLKKDSETAPPQEVITFERMAACIEAIKENLISVDCVVKETGEKLELDDLMLVAEAQELLMKAGTDLVQGVTLGKMLSVS